MKKIKKTALIIENGLFQSLAHKLSESFEKVIYWRPWVGSFAHPNDLFIGTGYDNIERIENYEEYFDADNVVWVFPDIYYASLQEWLRGQGKPVFGAGNGEEIELLRGECKELMKDVGLPVQPWETIKGMKALRGFIQKHPGWHVKVSTVRGLTESFHAIDYDLVKPKLDSIEHELGGRAEVQEFICEEGIPDSIESGYDGYFCNGFPKVAQFGIECKDKCYLAAIIPYQKVPDPVRNVNDKLTPTLKRYGYAGFFSTEVRMKGNKGYCIDFTCRSASPAGECMQELFLNLGDIVEGVANGKLIEPVIEDRFAAQVILTSSFADENWLPIEIPGKIRPFVKLYHSCKVGDQEFIVPGDQEMCELGSVVATGQSMDEAIKKVTDYVSQIKAFGLKAYTDELQCAKKDLMKSLNQ